MWQFFVNEKKLNWITDFHKSQYLKVYGNSIFFGILLFDWEYCHPKVLKNIECKFLQRKTKNRPLIRNDVRRKKWLIFLNIFYEENERSVPTLL